MLNSHPETPPFEYDFITDGIYIGTNQCCQTHFDERLITEEGIEADISLEAESVDAPFGVSFYLWLPTIDHYPPSQEQLVLGVNTLVHFVSTGKKVYVHCKNGHGRAPTLVAAYLMRKGGMSSGEAFEFIKKRRSSIHPWDDQRTALDKFQKDVQTK